MTEVWTTARGSRYHRSPQCEALAEGQNKAAAEGRWTYTPRPIQLNELTASLTPCSVCWAEPAARDRWLFIDHAIERQDDSQYEQEFLNRVLKRTPGLDADYVVAQHWTPGKSGRQYRLDFAVLRPERQRLAIEIDGFEKTPGRNEGDSVRQDQSTNRGNDLSNAGWKVLRFTNRQVITQPGDCRRVLEEALNLEEVRPSGPHTGARHAAAPPEPSRKPETAEVWSASPTPNPTISAVPRRSDRGLWLGAGLAGAAIVAAGFTGVMLAGGPSGGSEGQSAEPSGSRCPGGYPVKGNETGSGERIFHEPGWRYYDATWPEACFADADAAIDAGYRASEVQ